MQVQVPGLHLNMSAQQCPVSLHARHLVTGSLNTFESKDISYLRAGAGCWLAPVYVAIILPSSAAKKSSISFRGRGRDIGSCNGGGW